MPLFPNARLEYLPSYRFILQMNIDGNNQREDITFKECLGLELAQDLISIYEVTPQKWALANFGRVIRTKIPGNIRVESLTFRRGMTSSATLWNWIETVYSGRWSQQRRDGSLTVFDQAGTAQFRLDILGAWPIRYKAADVNSAGEEIEIEELEVAFDMIERAIV